MAKWSAVFTYDGVAWGAGSADDISSAKSIAEEDAKTNIRSHYKNCSDEDFQDITESISVPKSLYDTIKARGGDNDEVKKFGRRHLRSKAVTGLRRSIKERGGQPSTLKWCKRYVMVCGCADSGLEYIEPEESMSCDALTDSGEAEA